MLKIQRVGLTNKEILESAKPFIRRVERKLGLKAVDIRVVIYWPRQTDYQKVSFSLISKTNIPVMGLQCERDDNNSDWKLAGHMGHIASLTEIMKMCNDA